MKNVTTSRRSINKVVTVVHPHAAPSAIGEQVQPAISGRSWYTGPTGDTTNPEAVELVRRYRVLHAAVCPLRTIIAGSRTIRDPELIAQAVRASGFQITEVVSGRQRSRDALAGELYGADYFGELWAEKNEIPIAPFPADWTGLGKSAGPLRNEQMASYADALIAVWDGESKGTKDMIERARAHNLKVFVFDAAPAARGEPPQKNEGASL